MSDDRVPFDVRNFLTDSQKEALGKWIGEQDRKAFDMQEAERKSIDEDDTLSPTEKRFAKYPSTCNPDLQIPYYGMSGGGFSYTFYSDNVGLVIVAQNMVTKERMLMSWDGDVKIPFVLDVEFDPLSNRAAIKKAKNESKDQS